MPYKKRKDNIRKEIKKEFINKFFFFWERKNFFFLSFFLQEFVKKIKNLIQTDEILKIVKINFECQKVLNKIQMKYKNIKIYQILFKTKKIQEFDGVAKKKKIV